MIVVPAIGHFVSFGDTIAEIGARSRGEAMQIEGDVACAIAVESQRDIDLDPGCGIEQLEMIGWTSISSAKSNPTPGLFAIRSLRDILAHWSVQAPEKPAEPPLPIVFRDDTLRACWTASRTSRSSHRNRCSTRRSSR